MTITIDELRKLVAIQAGDGVLWMPASSVETAYTQQALRYLTLAIEGEWTFEQVRGAILEMMP